MKLKTFKIRAEFALTSTSIDGIDLIKDALLTAKNQVNDEIWQVDIKLIASSNYKCEVITNQQFSGEQKLSETLSIIKSVMNYGKGKFELKSEPKVLNDNYDFFE